MSESLTLPGDIPGLLRRGSPVLAVWGEECLEDGESSATGVVLSLERTIALCGWDQEDIRESGTRSHIDALHLDLSDPTGRAHALWWAQEHVDRAYPLPGWPGLPEGVADGRVEALRDFCLRLAGGRVLTPTALEAMEAADNANNNKEKP